MSVKQGVGVWWMAWECEGTYQECEESSELCVYEERHSSATVLQCRIRSVTLPCCLCC